MLKFIEKSVPILVTTGPSYLVYFFKELDKKGNTIGYWRYPKPGPVEQKLFPSNSGIPILSELTMKKLGFIQVGSIKNINGMRLMRWC